MTLIGGSKFDVKDPEKYAYLNPLFELLENAGEKSITKKEIIEKTKLDPRKVEIMLTEMTTIFAKALSKELTNPFRLLKMDNEEWFNKNLANSWLFDKFMLLGTRIDTGMDNPMDGNPLFDIWKAKWLEKRGM